MKRNIENKENSSKQNGTETQAISIPRTRKLALFFSTLIIFILGLNITYVGCSRPFKFSNNSQPLKEKDLGDRGPAGQDPEPIVAGNGPKLEGTGALTGPTTEAFVARLENGLEKNVNPSAGNFAASLAQVESNLPKSSDPTKATGFDKVQLLIYAACSDLVTGGQGSAMKTKYQVDPALPVQTAKANLINAGKRMLSQYTADLSSTSEVSSKVNDSLTKLIDKIGSQADHTTTMAFMGVCIAVNTTGTSMLGF